MGDKPALQVDGAIVAAKGLTVAGQTIIVVPTRARRVTDDAARTPTSRPVVLPTSCRRQSRFRHNDL